MIKILIIEDSSSTGKILTDILNSDSEIMVSGVAQSVKEAIELVPRLEPNLIIIDIDRPDTDGLEAIKYIMAYYPTPILIVSTQTREESMDRVFQAMSFGALDVLRVLPIDTEDARKEKIQELINRVKFLAKISVIHHPLAKLRDSKVHIAAPGILKKKLEDRIIGIAVSTGGPQTLLAILKKLPKDFPSAIIIVQHIAADFIPGLVEYLNKECQVEVCIAKDKEQIIPGRIYIAPSNFQMRVTAGGAISLSDEPPCNGFKPSGDILLDSIGRIYKKKAVGIILTGMGKDGASGIKIIKECGGRTIAQDEKTSVVFGMPKAAIDMGVIDEVLPAMDIADAILELLAH